MTQQQSTSSKPAPRPTSKSSLLIGIVGKPSSGKSTLLNAIAPNAKAEMAARPFTTIDPNQGQAEYQRKCLCSIFSKQDKCSPRYGSCKNGIRNIPVNILDVAGLIPGASEGLGLGNKFLYDLSTADVLIHVVDCSGTTNEKGEPTENYDAWNDVKWLAGEIHAWIFSNVWKKWEALIRRHNSRKDTAVETLNTILSGYGASKAFIQYVVQETKCETEDFYVRHDEVREEEDGTGSRPPSFKIREWKKSHVSAFIEQFIRLRFPIVLALNKVDKESQHTNRNIMKIYELYPNDLIVPCSALSELALQQLAKKKVIDYRPGDEEFTSRLDDPTRTDLTMPNEAQTKTLEKLRDIVFENYSGTGTTQLIKEAVELRDPVLVYWVSNLKNFTSKDSSRSSDEVFRDCALVQRKTSVGQFYQMHVKQGSDEKLAFCEALDGRKRSEHDPIMTDCVLRFVPEKL